MELDSKQQSPKYLTRKTVSTDGVTRYEFRLKPRTKRKVVVARGSNNLTGSHSVGAVVTSQLIPFRKYMIRQLNSRGFNTSKMNWKNIVILYHNEFVSNLHNKQSPFVPVDAYEFCNNFAFKIKETDNLVGDLRDFRNAEGCGQIGNIVDNIINTYKYAKGKYIRAESAGQNPKDVLSDVEYFQAKSAIAVEKKLRNSLEDNSNVKVGQVKKILIVAVVIFILYKLL
jgi:hypothetical protein